MDFRQILEDWERLSARPGGLDKASEAEKKLREEDLRRKSARAAGKDGESSDAGGSKRSRDARNALASWLDAYGVDDKDSRPPEAGDDEAALRSAREAERRRFLARKPEASIDLHGMTVSEAEAALSAFLEACARRGLEKVLVVTGKGIHSQGEPVLGKISRRVIEASPWAGRYGVADAASGGGGALWVALKAGDHFSR
jgi:DNA-nicking Smr family endonuclease